MAHRHAMRNLTLDRVKRRLQIKLCNGKEYMGEPEESGWTNSKQETWFMHFDISHLLNDNTDNHWRTADVLAESHTALCAIAPDNFEGVYQYVVHIFREETGKKRWMLGASIYFETPPTFGTLPFQISMRKNLGKHQDILYCIGVLDGRSILTGAPNPNGGDKD